MNYKSGIPTQILSLDGEWMLAHDSENIGREQQWWTKPTPNAKPVQVPWIIQDTFPGEHGVFWYRRDFVAPANPYKNGRYLLRFHAVDYLADVWVNNTHVGSHEGGETPFTLDITQAIRAGETNRVSVRVLNPCDERIDGILLAETPHRNKVINFHSGWGFDTGGIMESVELVITPAVRIDDLYVKPNVETGTIAIQATVLNAGTDAVTALMHFTICPASRGETLAVIDIQQELAVGSNIVKTELKVESPRLWDLADPYLYRVSAAVSADNGSFSEHSVRCGFRDFRVENGYFRLNGKRVFLKSTHTGNNCPGGVLIPPKSNRDVLIQDLLYAKTLGFNMVRFIAGIPHPYQLDFCDEIGLMVYEENYSGWLLTDSPDMKRRFDSSNREMILRDRNHPCITIWGLLNENPHNPIYEHAKNSLGLVRSLDDSRLVLLNSGRWDGEPSTGSASNPGGSVWEHVWSIESPDAPNSEMVNGIGGYFDRAGDAHAYPGIPLTPEFVNMFRNLGSDTKPVFLSEYGIGSLMNAIRETRKCEEAGLNPDGEDVTFLRRMAEKLTADWNRFGFDTTYAFPEDMLLESQGKTRWRSLSFDMIRANPKICGHNLTGMLDHGLTGEGLWTFWRELKPGMADVICDGWAPLKWCLFIDKMHNYIGEEIELEAVIANEDVLGPGDYPISLRVSGPSGIVWEKKTVLTVPTPPSGDDAPFAQTVVKEKVRLDVHDAGIYEFRASMDSGGAPAGGRLKFYISDPADLPAISTSVTLWGIDKSIENWLTSRGVECRQFSEESKGAPEVILIGSGETIVDNSVGWAALTECIRQGSSVVFLSPKSCAKPKDETSTGWLPLQNKGRCYEHSDWLYHKECVAKAHPIFDGLQCKGILDLDYYGPVLSPFIFDGLDTPDDVALAAFAVGHSDPAGGYSSGLMICSYAFGKGRIILNTLKVLDNVGKHPAADRLLLNMINYAGSFL